MSQNGTNDSKAPKRDPLKPPHRRLVVMFDGTGNLRLNLSNVARMFEAIDDSTPQEYETYPEVGRGVPYGKPVLEPEREPVQHLKYIKGVGTDKLGHISGLGFGYGLSKNVIKGYVWLSNRYCEGDEIFVFGFSRGAFSARSLVSLVHRCGGVLKNGSILAENAPPLEEDCPLNPVVEKAYDMYQAYVQTTTADGKTIKDPALYKNFYNKWQDFKTTATKASFGIHRVTIKMLGVWDTVGAVGLPETGCRVFDDNVFPFSRYSGKHYQFHSQGLSCIVENAYHALAIDEHRRHFSPTLWDSVTSEEQEVKQVWFVGSHCNVGGGADLDDLNDPDDLWQYSYVWMQNHAIKHGLRFYWTYNSPPTQTISSQGTPLPTRRVSLRKPEDSYALFLYGSYKWIFSRFQRKTVEKDATKLHWSATDRIAAVDTQGERPPYRPETLFGEKGTQFTKVEPDIVELPRLVDTPGSVSTTQWQIETDDAEHISKPLRKLKVVPCNCGPDPVAPVRQTGFWSWFGF